MATTYTPIPVIINSGGRSAPRRSARDICMNDYNYTEDPELSECMQTIVETRAKHDNIVSWVGGSVLAIAFIGLIALLIFLWRE